MEMVVEDIPLETATVWNSIMIEWVLLEKRKLV